MFFLPSLDLAKSKSKSIAPMSQLNHSSCFKEMGTDCPGKWLIHRPWGCLKDIHMCGPKGSVELKAELSDLRGLFQPK